jgi:hypothetical protein
MLAVLRVEGFFCSVDLLYGDLWIGQLQFLKRSFFFICKFL